MGVSKVIFDGNTLIDLTEDSVTPDQLRTGATAHDAAGNKIVGTYEAEDVSAETAEYTEKLTTQDVILNRIGNSLRARFAVPSSLQSKTVTPSTSQQVISADDGYDGLSVVMVNPIPKSYTDEVYNSGYDDGHDTGYSEGRSVGYSEGHNVGYSEGRSAGYNEGHDVGYSEGRSVGYNEGHSVGYNEGHTAGYNEAVELYKPYSVELEYIESTGMQYIDTSYKWKSENVKIEIGFEYTSMYNNNSLFGSEIASGNKYSLVPWCDGTNVGFYIGSSGGLLPTRVYANTKYDMACSAVNNTLTVTLNGTTKTARYSGSIQNGLPIAIFANNIYSGASQFARIKLRYFKMYDNGVLVRDYIPVLDKSGVACLYDKVSGSRYYNAGTGSFSYA